MSEPNKNVVRDVRQAFDLSGVGVGLGRAEKGRDITYRAKVFKSGNSLALRLPKALGLEKDMEMELTADGAGGYVLRLAEPPKRKIDISGFWGKAPGIKLAPREDFDERPSTVAAREAARKVSEGK